MYNVAQYIPLCFGDRGENWPEKTIKTTFSKSFKWCTTWISGSVLFGHFLGWVFLVMKCFRCKTDADEDAAGKPSPSEFMIGPCVSYPANDPGEGGSLVLSYNHRRDQQGPLRSVWQHLAKSQDILKQRREAILLNFEVASVVTPLTILTPILPCPKILIGILLAINLNPTDDT